MTILRAAALAAALVAGLAGLIAPAQAQTAPKDWPNRPVKFIIPFGPGAGADIGARLLIEPLQAKWGKPLVIENRPGGDSMVAIQAFLAANDDHTLLWGPSGNFTVHPVLYEKLPYNPDDLIPIARFSNTILAVGTPAAMNFKDLKDFVTRGLQENGKWNGTAVPGVTDFAFDYFAKTAGLQIQKIAYRDTVQAATDVGEGRIQVYSSSYAILRPQTEAGRIKVLVVMGPQRAPSLPDLPTATEAGYPNLTMEGLVGLFGLKSMSPELMAKIGADIMAVGQDKAIEQRLATTAQTLNLGGPKEFAASIDAQRKQIANIAATVGTKKQQ
jgi:tripartite-type tricarboxylate transporter receptor subunit TctC